jgi:hypothetical protein
MSRLRLEPRALALSRRSDRDGGLKPVGQLFFLFVKYLSLLLSVLSLDTLRFACPYFSIHSHTHLADDFWRANRRNL